MNVRKYKAAIMGTSFFVGCMALSGCGGATADGSFVGRYDLAVSDNCTEISKARNSKSFVIEIEKVHDVSGTRLVAFLPTFKPIFGGEASYSIHEADNGGITVVFKRGLDNDTTSMSFDLAENKDIDNGYYVTNWFLRPNTEFSQKEAELTDPKEGFADEKGRLCFLKM